ncbi:MAG: hypothetical protein LAP38_12620 [Acidobacteriia bacterium]|nr:hypothetical protein [Terriglobia bacterium]
MSDCAFAIALLAALAPLGAAAAGPTLPAEQPVVMIVTTSAVEAFAEAIEGVRRGLGSGVKVVVVDLAARPAERGQLSGKDVAVLLTIGNQAMDEAAQLGSAPMVATMVLRADLAAPGRRAPSSAVVLDVALADVLAGLSRVFPGKTRVGMIRNPDQRGAPAAALEAQAKAAGMTLKAVECPRPEKLLNAFLSLRDLVDFVWCPPDATLYNGTTVKPLILASLENRLPVAGFSASFVRAGAAAGVYPDYLEVGAQAGELARKYLGGANPAVIENPRKVRVASNPRVARLLGLRMPSRGEPGIVVIE